MLIRIPSPAASMNRLAIAGTLAVIAGLGACFTAPKIGASQRFSYDCPGERVVSVRNSSGVAAELFTWRPGKPAIVSEYIGSLGPGKRAEFTIPDSVMVSVGDPHIPRAERPPQPFGESMRFEYSCR